MPETNLSPLSSRHPAEDTLSDAWSNLVGALVLAQLNHRLPALASVLLWRLVRVLVLGRPVVRHGLW